MSEPIRDYTKLGFWQRSQLLYIDALQDVRNFPKRERGVSNHADQLLRSVGSISANIAEGYSSDTTTEYCRYLGIARKSAGEARDWYLKAGAAGYLRNAAVRIDELEQISKMLYATRRTLQGKIARGLSQ